MKTIIFCDEINYVTIHELIKNIEIINASEELIGHTYIRKIYFSTSGGLISAGNILIDYINNNTNFSFIFIATDQLISTGFEIFTKLNCSKKILQDTFGIIHAITKNKSEKENRCTIGNEHVQTHLTKTLETDIKNQINHYREIGIKETDIKKILSGEHIFINNEELLKIIENIRPSK